MAQFIGLGNAHDGFIPASGDVNTRASCTGSAGNATVTTSLSVQVGDMVALFQERGSGVGAWEMVVVISTGAGNFTAHKPLDNTYTDSGNSQAQAVLIPQSAGGTISGTIAPSAWDQNVGGVTFIVASGRLVISGNINANGMGFLGGVGSGGNGESTPVFGLGGEGSVGVRLSTNSNNGNGGGAGSNNRSPWSGYGVGHGGGGGYATAGTNGDFTSGSATGYGGVQDGSADLTDCVFGGGGGAGGCDWPPSVGNVGGNGGRGGGKVFVFARELIITGSISVNGNIGGNAGGPNNNKGGAGGSAGSIFIKGQYVDIGTNKLLALGGSYGSNTSGSTNSGIGALGRIRIEACKLVGSTNQGSVSISTGGHSWCGLHGGMI